MSGSTLVRRCLPLLALAVALGTAACSHGASNASNAAGAATATSADSMPVYPGAKLEAASMSSMLGPGAASGKAYSTGDSFDKVYDWYKKNLPGGSEQSHVTSPDEAAVFLMGSPGDRLSVTITASPICCKTLFVIAHAKA